MKPVIHPSVMMRREVAEATGGYRQFSAAEDRDFWLRALDRYRFDRLEGTLLDYRIHCGGVSRDRGSGAEVSSAMSAVNWLVFQDTGVDMFVDRTDLFADSAATVRQRIEGEVLPGAVAFRSARSAVRSGHYFAGLATFADALMRHGAASLPDGARVATRRIIDDTVASSCRLLTVE
jgi:hypothetical protein